MKTTFSLPTAFTTCLLAFAAAAAEPALTIYNQNFAVVRETIPLDLKAGVNQVRFAGATTYLEPSSVILRDPASKRRLQILEQNFRGDPVSQELLLDLNEGKTIDFERVTPEAGHTKRERVSGKIIRSGYLGYGAGGLQPIIEVNGKLQFSLPGQPIFPALADGTVLKPTLLWLIETDDAAKFDAELSYVTGGMRWEADYNLVLPERGDLLDMVGWITMDNASGKSFEQARIKLMAGDVNKIQANERGRLAFATHGGAGGGAGEPPVKEKAFDEYHLYTLERPTTLLDREKKQVEFVRGTGVNSVPIYIYDGASATPEEVWGSDAVHTEPEYGTKCNQHIWVMREFTNSVANHLGLPLPKGRVRVYRRNSDGQLEFTGENVIKHTPRDEVIRLVMGNAFDLMGERQRTNFNIKLSGNAGLVAIDPATGLPLPAKVDPDDKAPGPWIDESFEIKLRNHKPEAVEIRVVEHLYRWVNWKITEKSDDWIKTDAQTMELRVRLKPDETKILAYKVHYWW